MKTLLLSFLSVLIVVSPTETHAQNYELKVSSLIETCDFIHQDEYSFKPILSMLQEQLKTKLEGDKKCSAPLSQLNNQLIELDSFFASNLTEQQKKQLTQDAQKQYLTDLQGELAILNPALPTDAARIAVLQSLMDTVKANLVTLGVEAQVASYEDQKNKQTALSNYWEGAYNKSSAAIAAMNSVPDECIDRIGGWKAMIPTVLNLASMSGQMVGGKTGSFISAGFQMGAQLAVLLQNNRVKKAITATTRIQNHQIIACSYLALQTNACELKRAKKLMDHKKIYELINREFTDPKYGQYERYFRLVETLPHIQKIFNDIGSMGSALTLDLSLLQSYFSAVKLQPESIVIPPESSSDNILSDFVVRMKGRGLVTSSFDTSGAPLPIRAQYENLKVLIEQAKQLIETVKGILTSKRSFVDLKEEIVTKNQFAVNELRFFRTFIQYYLNGDILPDQYVSIFKINENMLDVLIEFVGADMKRGETIEAYRARVDVLGQKLFDEMSVGSVAQITSQTVLMIPAIAFERFNRPVKALEHLFVSNDIVYKDDPTHPSYTDYVVNKSLQMKLIGLYEPLNGSGQAFRIETYLAALKGVENGFKRDIVKMVKNAMNSKSDILEEFEGKTAAQLCALFAPFLKEEAPGVLKDCQSKYLELDLYPVLTSIHRPSKMKIDYSDSCFYNNYKREERGQRRLFEKLIDYGSRNNLVWD